MIECTRVLGSSSSLLPPLGAAQATTKTLQSLALHWYQTMASLCNLEGGRRETEGERIFQSFQRESGSLVGRNECRFGKMSKDEYESAKIREILEDWKCAVIVEVIFVLHRSFLSFTSGYNLRRWAWACSRRRARHSPSCSTASRCVWS